MTSPATAQASTSSSAPDARLDVDYVLIAFKGASRAPVAVTRTKDEARRRAAEVCKKAQAGADFASLARQYSDDKQVYVNFARASVAKPFGDAAFSLTPGSVSAVVEADYGFFVIKRRR